MRTDDLMTLPAGLSVPVFKQHTLVISDGRIGHVFYPGFPSDRDAVQVLDWLRA
jgi:hypothetical protein